MRGNIINEKNIPDMVMFPLYSYEEIEQRILNPAYVKIIQEQHFTSHMQPIFCTQEESVYGYEFLLRPSREDFPFYPGELFSFSRRSGMHSMLDSQARINAIRTGSEKLGEEEMLFINFLPSSIYDPAHCLKSTFEAVDTYQVNPKRLVFEVVETEQIHDMTHLKTIFHEYQKSGVKVALDDIGSGFATNDVLQELRPDYAKIDRQIIQNCHLDENKLETIEEISRVSKEQGTFLLAEGIENKAEYMAVKKLVDYCQGYYFAKPEKDPYVSYSLR
ncbi:EAL domain-containing protein [Salisediminibacterium beveridgei]|uniref:EAL domain-containing protein n=1 Tax=Salisediminibacterium beveridgei TaxID=632773 RepID=UPI0018DB689B|nr:EAL domain-containing protein [Salisediminibacterium beveridgei]